MPLAYYLIFILGYLLYCLIKREKLNSYKFWTALIFLILFVQPDLIT